MDLSLKEHLLQFLNTHQLVGRDRESHFVIAYSGGRDSTALLHSLAQLKSESQTPVQITVAYYWHPWRPLQEDLQIVHHNCKAARVQWIMLTPDLTMPKNETAARQDRYRQLARLACDLKASAVLTAHHQDDQIETILFRLLRGTGVEGITGIPAIRSLESGTGSTVTLARPFVDVPRALIDAYVQSSQLKYVDDPTNTEVRIKRNYIRHELLPRIETAFPNARQSLSRLADLAEGEMVIIDKKMEEVWQDVFDAEGSCLDETRFNQLDHPFQRRVIKQFLEDNGYEAGFSKIEEVIAFIAGKGRKFNAPALFSLDDKHFLHLYRNRITIEAPKEQSLMPLEVSVPGEVCHRDLKMAVTIKQLSFEERMKPMDFTKFSQNTIFVDLSKFADKTLVFRSRQKGDIIRPLGMDSPIKLKRFLINRCIPRFKRDAVPLLTVESKVLWAVGVEVSEDIKVKDRPTHSITIEYVNKE